MARDRNVYAWQAYVVVMSIVSFISLGALIWVVFQSGTKQKQVEAALDRERAAKGSLLEQSSKSQLLVTLLGGGGKKPTEGEIAQLKSSIPNDPEVDAIYKRYNTDIALLGPAAKDQTYTNLVTTLTQELRKRNEEIDLERKKELDLEKKYQDSIAQETKMREAEKQKAQDLSNQLQKAQITYTENINAQQQTITKIEMDKQNLNKQFEKTKRDLIAQNEGLRKENETLTRRNGELAEKIRVLEGEDFQYVQGQITELSDGGQTVWINLGKADGLRPGVRFGVLDADASRVADIKPKARIEIVSVIQESEHLSRAKVLPERFPATILRGDKVFSPAWQPGKKVNFALVGKMDINGDGVDDREAIIALIQQNQGEVTCDLPPTGKMTGELSVDTRWMVVGEDFKAVGDATDKSTESAAKERAKLEQQAKALGISRINVDKLMGWLRGSGTQDVVPLGNAIRSGDFIERKYKDPSKGSVSGLYQTPTGKVNPQGQKPQ